MKQVEKSSAAETSTSFINFKIQIWDNLILNTVHETFWVITLQNLVKY